MGGNKKWVTHACAYGRYSVKVDARTVDADLWVCLRRRWRCVAVVHVESLAAVDVAKLSCSLEPRSRVASLCAPPASLRRRLCRETGPLAP